MASSAVTRRLERYAAELDAQADTMLARPDTTPPPAAVGIAQPTVVHQALVDLLDDVLSLGLKAGHGGNPILMASLRAIRRLRQPALEELARVPQDEILVFMRQLIGRFEHVLEKASAEGVNDAPTDGPGTPQLAGAGTRVPGGRQPDGQIDAG